MQAERLTGAVQRLVHPIQARGRIPAGRLAQIMQLNCVRKLCIHVQILRGRLFLVAPHSQRCPPGTASLRSNCSLSSRKRLQSDGKWDPTWSPTPLEWDFAAGVNVSSCAGSIIPGDFNGAYSRLRLTTQLRLLEEAAHFGNLSDTELVLCANETPLTAGGWCLPSEPQPIFASVTNEEAPSLPLPHWLPRLRDVDLATWDESRRSQTSSRSPGRVRGAQARAVFRGGQYRLNVYTDEWRTRGVHQTPITTENWRHVGRPSLISLKERNAEARDLLDANVDLPTAAEYLGISERTFATLDKPVFLPLEEQQMRFRYALNVEGHGGWADRLFKLFLSPLLVLAQDVPARLWYEALTASGSTHLVVDSNLRNLTAVIQWAKSHDAEVDRMVSEANAAMEVATSVSGMRYFVRELVESYTQQVLDYRPRRDPRAIGFSCLGTHERRSCRVPDTSRDATKRRILRGVRCQFVVAGRRGRSFASLHAASEYLAHAGVDTDFIAKSPPPPPPSQLTSELTVRAKAMLCPTPERKGGKGSQTSGMRMPRGRGENGAMESQFCFQQRSAASCRRLSVHSSECQGQPMACVWMDDLQTLGAETLDVACPTEAAKLSRRRGQCFAACCPNLCNVTSDPPSLHGG